MEIPPWIINPFDETEVENVMLQEELLELSTNEKLKVTFKRGYQKFWLRAEIPENHNEVSIDRSNLHFSFRDLEIGSDVPAGSPPDPAKF
ncbi:hypothetical protein EVAR_56167_1 [Eumeta japonica]|uniref:Uncharacterized protein n=1 Tax=Eumeta variegata TaxID=151549 RepID=A0A4C1Y4S2_EUMVA|nr:hypothetical protein EVAR_56167_1 [Eumeta japonica]